MQSMNGMRLGARLVSDLGLSCFYRPNLRKKNHDQEAWCPSLFRVAVKATQEMYVYAGTLSLGEDITLPKKSGRTCNLRE